MSAGAPARPDPTSLDSSSLARRFVGGAAWSVAGAVVSGGVAVLTAMVVARTLGKAGYGQFVVIQSTLGMVAVFAGFGIAATATRYVAELRQRDPTRLGDILTLSERVVLAFGVVGTIGLAASAGWTASHALNEEALRVPLVIAAASVLFTAVDGYQKGVLIGFESMQAYAIGLVAGAMAGLPIMWLATSSFGLRGSAAAIAVNAVIQAGISRYQMLGVFREFGVRPHASGSLREIPVLWTFALPALLGAVVVAPSHWVAQAMLAHTPNGYAELAVLGIVMQWFGVIMFVPVAVGRMVLPMLTAHVTQDDAHGPRRILLYAIGGNALVAFPMAAIVCVFGRFILGLYGKSFAADVTPLIIGVATAALVAIQTPVGYLLAAASRMWLGALMNAVWSIVYLGLAYLLLGRGATGILIALAAAYAVQTVWTGWYAFTTTDRNTRTAVTKKRILYVMHVDWGWIKQRPHFLAEGLSTAFDVLVVHPRANRRSQLSRNQTALSRVPIWALPFGRLKAISVLNACIRALYFRVLLFAYRPSVVWLTFPTVVPAALLNRLTGKVVVYDCMDNAPEFKSDESERNQIRRAEQQLLERADMILISSENLRGKILERGAAQDKLILIRNAFGGIVQPEPGAAHIRAAPVDVFRILYFGTISDYLDFDVILHCLDMVEGVEFHFFGPAMVDLPSHPRLTFHGTVEHDSLAARAQEFDCFVMPFVVNELVQGVDPVKLYEYVNLGKNILCPYYPELDRFSAFVSFYRSRDEFIAAVRALMAHNEVRYDAEQRRRFLEANSWPVRAVEVVQRLDRCVQLNALDIRR